MRDEREREREREREHEKKGAPSTDHRIPLLSQSSALASAHPALVFLFSYSEKMRDGLIVDVQLETNPSGERKRRAFGAPEWDGVCLFSIFRSLTAASSRATKKRKGKKKKKKSHRRCS